MDVSGLLPHQPEPARHIFQVLNHYGAAINGSSTGIGKTYEAGAIIRAMNLPTLVVAPKVGRPGWEEMGKRLGVEFDFTNWEMVRTGRTPYYRYDETTNEGRWADEVGFIVFDEIHRGGGIDTLNAQMIVNARRQRKFVLGLSATLGDSPVDLWAIGYILGLHCLEDVQTGPFTVRPGFYRWARQHKCAPGLWGKYDFQGTDADKRAIMGLINAEIFPKRGVRVRKEDLPGFPECQIITQLYDMGGQEKVNALWAEMKDAMDALRGRAADDKNPAHPMTRVLRARESLELLKVPTYCELGKDLMSQGYSLAVFVCFRSTLDEICKRLDIRCRIDGSQTGDAGMRQREGFVKLFQDNVEQAIASTVDAGGIAVNLGDRHGGHPRAGIVSLGYSAEKVQQVFGRLPRADSKTKSTYYVPLAAGTLDERVHRAVAAKLNRGEALMDGDLDANCLAIS